MALSPSDLSLRLLVPAGLALAVTLAAEPARACSCARLDIPDPERCRTAAHVYAGTVAAVELPSLFEPEASTVVRLDVDTVWRGDVPRQLLAYTGGPCGWVVPTPGWSFVACDDHDDPRWTAFSFCGQPAFEPAPALRASLGPGHAPTAPPALAWQPWRTQEFAVSLLLVLALPLLALVGGAALGRVRRRDVGVPGRVRLRLLSLAAVLVVARLVFRAVAPDSDQRGPIVLAVTILLAALVAAWLAHRGQRARLAWRGVVVAVLGAGLILLAGFVRLHSPFQPPGALACSEARAREFLRTVPISVDLRDDEHGEWDPSPATVAAREEALRLAADAVPRMCTDFGLRRMRFDPDAHDGPCLDYDDGDGGARRMCARQEHTRHVVERPG